MFKVRRSLLFIPADRPERIAKAAALPTDVVVVELEDGVAPERKAMAREEAGRALAEIDFGFREVALRVNRISTLHGLADMMALAKWPRKPELIILPKVESAGEVRIYDELLTNINVNSQLMPLIESSRGLQAVGTIVMASPRISSLAFGIADLSAELGCQPTWEPMLFCRASMVSAGGLAGVPLIDPPYLNIKDESGLLEECKRVRDMGYIGKMCIHPSQLEPVNQAFTPTLEEVERARKINEAAATQGGGAIVVDGRMVDRPVVISAQRVVAMADRLGIGRGR
jgi:citrate lyase beta subunit